MKEKNIELNIEEFTKAFKQLGEAVGNVTKAIVKTVNSIAENIKEAFKMLTPPVCENKRVFYLAKHSKKKRIRKKNINRFIKLIEKEYKCKLFEWQKEYIRRLLYER